MINDKHCTEEDFVIKKLDDKLSGKILKKIQDFFDVL